jgi:hypothetical protein
MGIWGVGIMDSTAFLFLACSSSGVDKNQKMELTIGSPSFYVGPSGSTRLSDPTESGPSASNSKTIIVLGSSVGSSSEVNSPVSLEAGRNPTGLRKNLTGKDHRIRRAVVKRTSPQEAVASLEAYINYVSLSPK